MIKDRSNKELGHAGHDGRCSLAVQKYRKIIANAKTECESYFIPLQRV